MYVSEIFGLEHIWPLAMASFPVGKVVNLSDFLPNDRLYFKKTNAGSDFSITTLVYVLFLIVLVTPKSHVD